MPNTLFEAEVTSYDESELMDKKSTLRALNLKRDNLAIEMASKLGLTGFFSINQIDFDDPKVSALKDDFQEVVSKIGFYSWEVDRLESIRDGELPRHNARVKVYAFLNGLGNDNATNFLKSHRLSTVTLTEAVLLCPNLLEDMMNFEENLEIIRSKSEVWW